ncbi:hypothetical protein BB560_004709 [Smittium megazygosporum]|uniref:Glyoxylate reductase n=1 Tax=Smittium megazygosporum TaxID=133381 RepID=A0A2T9Z8G1_9FUNG|nr:hypothetical protein BB560_004709 [Smittium megazygosporum]
MSISKRLQNLVKTFSSNGSGTLVVTATLPPRTQALIKSLESSTSGKFKLIQWRNEQRPTRNELLNLVQGASGVLCMLTDKIDGELIRAAGPQLKVVSTMSVGYDHINTKVLHENNILIGNTPGVLTNATSDIAALLLLGAARRAKEGVDAVENSKWGVWNPNWLLGVEFSGKTLGIVGLGGIGAATAARLIPFGFSKILYSGSRQHKEKEALLADIHRSVSNFNTSQGLSTDCFECKFVSTDLLIKESDVVILCCALNENTRMLINKSNINDFKQGGILINPARGPIVDPEALLHGLESNRLFAAGLDVTDPEPIKADDPLVSHPRCFIMPHLGSATVETREAMSDLALENLLAGVLGDKLTASV